MNKRVYGTLSFNKKENKWIIDECEPHVSLRLKKIFPKIGDYAIPPFSMIANKDTSADLFWFIQRYPLKISNKDYEILSNDNEVFFKEQADLEKILLPKYKSKLNLNFKEGCKLRDYQNKGVALHHKVKRLLLVDDIGLGKTYEAFGACLMPGTLPAAIVVQTHLQGQWAEKAFEFTNLKVHKIEKRKPYSLPKADIYIFKYGQISGWVDIFAQGFFKMAVYDEIQELRRGKESSKGVGADILSKNVDYVLGLTATPIYNYGIEMFNIMEYIKPGSLGTRYEFLREWCTGDDKSVKNPKALGAYLRENFLMLRRTRADVGREMSKVTSIVQNVSYDERAVKSAEELAKKLAITALSGSFTERGQAARQLDIKAREMTGVSKAKYVAEFIKMVVDTGEPVIVGGWHRDFYNILLKELKDYSPLMYTGSETPKQKEETKRRFLEGESKIMILSLRSGAGLDGLQNICSTVIIGELDWSPKVHEQLIGRVDRDGQEKPVVVFYLVSEYGSDPIIVSLLGLKESQSRGIIDHNIGPEFKQSNKDKLKELAKSYLSNKELNNLKSGEKND